MHQAAFPGRGLTLLGSQVLIRYYDFQMHESDEVVALGAFYNEALAGFCFGGRFKSSWGGFLDKHWKFLLWQVVKRPGLVRNSLIRDRIRLGMHMIRSQPSRKSIQPGNWQGQKQPSFGILSIAVHPKYQGMGIGQRLMMESEQIALEHGYRHMHLTVESDNEPAIRFYEALGWEKVIRDSGWAGKMQKFLSGESSSGFSDDQVSGSPGLKVNQS